MFRSARDQTHSRVIHCSLLVASVSILDQVVWKCTESEAAGNFYLPPSHARNLMGAERAILPPAQGGRQILGTCAEAHENV